MAVLIELVGELGHVGGDYFTRLNPQKARSNAVRQLEAMGYHVTLSNDQNLWMTLGEGA
ncbi:hypothetical protein [Mycolicibacterium brumae]|uniref:hypothetical protein n=1 Tax=Mycolicibacterium brumae TaxID=85968 RepID=UPI000B32AC44|nr:hypothetical protein [Mycolicibacterium brumae]